MSDWPPDSFELCKGPQDGSKVYRVEPVMPQRIYVGRRWHGDGYSAWAKAKSARFPCCYVMDGYKFVYRADE